MDTVGRIEFRNELRIPPLAESSVDGQGRRVFRLELRPGLAELLPGTRTETWGANGPYLGPTLRASRRERVRVEVTNGLPEETTLHWHGMHLPAKADGNPHQPIGVGETWAPEWTIDQPAATLWYHPHQMGRTAEHVYRGVAGLFLVDDPAGSAAPLPSTYGVDDVPVIIQDKRFEDDGSLDLSPGLVSPIGILGDEILINGTYAPYLRVTTERVRLRLLNASNARVYNVGFADDRPFALVATDGGLLEAPQTTTRIQLSPAERAEIVVRLEPGERLVLRSFEPELGTNFWEGRFAGADDSFDLMELRAAERLEPSPPLPERLADHHWPDEREAVATRRFELSGQSSINGKSMDMERIDVVATAGTTEIWEIENASGTPHGFHPHDIRFRVLDLDGEPPPPELRGWKDTVYVPPGSTVRFAARFGGYTDPDTPYMYHCHVLQHEDRGMMGQFVVVGSGQEARSHHHGAHGGRTS